MCPVSVFIRSCCVFKPHPKLQLPLWILHTTHGTHIKEKSLDPRDPSIWIGNICRCFFYCVHHKFCCLFFFRNNQQLFNRLEKLQKINIWVYFLFYVCLSQRTWKCTSFSMNEISKLWSDKKKRYYVTRNVDWSLIGMS